MYKSFPLSIFFDNNNLVRERLSKPSSKTTIKSILGIQLKVFIYYINNVNLYFENNLLTFIYKSLTEQYKPKEKQRQETYKYSRKLFTIEI